MRKLFLTGVLICASIISKGEISKPEPSDINTGEQNQMIMSFDFEQIGGKNEFQDKTGKYTVYSDSGKFLEEDNALRIAFGARFRIPCENDAFGERFTISVWIVKSSRLGRDFRTPILTRGFVQAYAGPIPDSDKFDFLFELNSFVPGFKTSFGGLLTSGEPYNGDFRYTNSAYQRIPPKDLFKMDKWQNITTVYDNGTIKMYINGQLSAETNQKFNQSLLKCKQPLYLGASRVECEGDNKNSSEILIKNLTIYKKALNDSEIKAVFEKESKGYPLDKTYQLTATKNYFPKDMLDLDQEMKTRLSLTNEYLKNKPEDSYKNNKTMSGKFTGTPRSLKFLVNEKSVPPVAINNHPYDQNEHRHNELIADFAATDVNLVGGSVLTSDFWIGENEYDWEKLDKRIYSFIKINPSAMISIKFGSSPPFWFGKKYPEELEEYYIDRNNLDLGTKKWTTSGPLGSEKWLNISTKMISDFVKHIESSDYRNHVYGYSIAGGDAGEWYWPGQFAGPTGYSKPTLESFKKFIQNKYNNDIDNLRKAWREPSVMFETIQMPTPSERIKTENYIFNDPTKNSKSLDFCRFINHQTLRNFNESCKAVKENTADDKIICTYYGYSLYYAGRGVLHMSGLQGVSDVFKSPWINAIATPLDYLKRRGGEPGVNIAGFNGTAQLNKKMIWREEDIRTHFYPRLEWGRTSSLRESMEVIRRAFSYTVAENYGMWFVCQAEMWAFHQKEMMEDIKKMMKIASESSVTDRRDAAEVALIFDEKESLTAIAPTVSDFIVDHIWGTYQNAHCMGAPFKLYFIDDLANAEMPDFKMYVFINPYSINDKQMKMIENKVKKNNAVAVWSYAPGYLSDKGFDIENMKKLTGFNFSEEKKQRTVGGIVNPKEKSPITANITTMKEYSFGPVFSVKEQESKILANYKDLNVLAVKEFENWKSVYSLLPLTPALLTGLCDYAKVHVYNRDGDLLLANSSYVAVHASKAGKKRIELPETRSVVEQIENKNFGTVKSFEDEISMSGTTRIYKLN